MNKEIDETINKNYSTLLRKCPHASVDSGNCVGIHMDWKYSLTMKNWITDWVYLDRE